MAIDESHDPVLEALKSLERFIEGTLASNKAMLDRAAFIRERRERGQAYRDIVGEEERPLIVEVLSQRVQDLADASSAFRRAEAQALYAEGLTMAEIADLFGVTRQRVAALLRTDLGGDESTFGSTMRKIGSQVTGEYSAWIATPLAALGAVAL